MVSSQRLSLSARRLLDRLSAYSKRAPAGATMSPGGLIRTIRVGLHMTQTQLAKRAGIPQSHLARLEGGKVDPQLSTLRKVLGALSCEVLLLPSSGQPFSQALEQRIKEKARRNVLRFAKKRPPEALQALLAYEERRLRESPSSALWED